MRDSRAMTLMIMAMMICSAVFVSCKQCEPIVKVEYRDSISIQKVLDSVYVYNRDSIYVDRITKGDTVYVTTTNVIERYKDKVIEVRDTIRNIDTVYEKEQVRYVPLWIQRYVGVTVCLILLALGYFAVKVLRKFFPML